HAAVESRMRERHDLLGGGMFARGALAAARWIAGRAPGE
ncbi:4-hydroxy-tetrahydrodipicolinate reductase, partial [Rhizobium johnstonii]